jgi:hypothetical protein
MADNSKIAENHLDTSVKDLSSSAKFVIPIILLLISSWLFVIEPIFLNAKFNFIKKEKYQAKRIEIISENTINKTGQKELNRFNENISSQDSLIKKEIINVIEETVPKPFNSILKFAAIDNYGILIVSLSATFLTLYLFLLRKENLRKICIALRILKTDCGFNSLYDYNLQLPFWISPIPKDSKNGLKNTELLKILGWGSKNYSRNFLIFLFLGLFITMQCRLYYISLISNGTIFWLYILMIISLSLSFLTTILWILPTQINDTYNSETPANYHTRRNLIIASVTIFTGLLIGFNSKTLRNGLISFIKKPRFQIRKKISKELSTEQKALKNIQNKNLIKASEIILIQIKTDSVKYKYNIRLFDLLVLLCLKDKLVHSECFPKLITIAKQSNYYVLLDRVKKWENKNWKWRKVVSKGKELYWDKIKF